MPLFVPDLPGYGLSAALQKHDKHAVGSHLISGLASLLKNNKSTSGPQPIILIGHDRGGRVSHRLSVSKDTITGLGLELLATCVIDIVPTTVQWQAFGYSPLSAVGYWHWPFLASPFGPEMIKSYGPKRYIKDTLGRIAGPNKEKLEAGDSLEVYGAAFERDGVVEATCGDYAAGAFPDVEAQTDDQKAGRKVDVPLLVLTGATYIAKTFDAGKVWSDWVASPNLLKVHQAADGVGHFVPEEAPEETVETIVGWLKSLKVVEGL